MNTHNSTITPEYCAEWAEKTFASPLASNVGKNMSDLLFAADDDYETDSQRLRAAYRKLYDMIESAYEAKPCKKTCKDILYFLKSDNAHTIMFRQFPSLKDGWNFKIEQLLSYTEHWTDIDNVLSRIL